MPRQIQVQHQTNQNKRSKCPMISFKVLTFDVVGTLIDFETGVLDAVRKISGRKAGRAQR